MRRPEKAALALGRIEAQTREIKALVERPPASAEAQSRVGVSSSREDAFRAVNDLRLDQIAQMKRNGMQAAVYGVPAGPGQQS